MLKILYGKEENYGAFHPSGIKDNPSLWQVRTPITLENVKSELRERVQQTPQGTQPKHKTLQLLLSQVNELFCLFIYVYMS